MAVEGADLETASGIPEGIAAVGDIIGGKFVVERVLGIGGMGVVVAARHLQLGQTVAIKLLRRGVGSAPEAVNRFVREARAVAGLQSAHVVRVMDVGALDDGLPYMVMEHLSGTDLGHVLEVRRVLPAAEAVDYLLQAMEAVAEAHGVGIVHRDLKPSNLFLTVRPDGAPLVKVLDFGISKAMDESAQAQSLTSTATVLGSPLYMSPEQVRSTKNVDTRTDIWALGVILYELLAGAPPFEAETVTGLCAKIVADPPVSVRSRRPDLSSALASVIMRCLDKDVNRRFQSVADLAESLRPFASDEGKLAVDRVARIVSSPRSSRSVPGRSLATVGPSAEQGEVPSGYAETVASRQTSGALRRRRGVATLAIAAVVAVALFMVVSRFPRAAAPASARHAAVVLDRGVAPPRTLDVQAGGPTTVDPPSAHGALAVASSAESASTNGPPAPSAPAATPKPARASPSPPSRPVTAASTSSNKPADDLLLERN
jgi:eukaryotic-like serine/threonine-protein kinase